jgi:hypothetical protein
MQDRVMGVIIADLLVVLTFSDHSEDRAEMRISKDQNKDQGVMQISKDRNKDQAVVQISDNQKEARTQGNHIIVLQGIQVPVTPQELQVFVDLPTVDLAFNDPPADPVVQNQEVREIQAIVKEEEIDLPEFLR